MSPLSLAIGGALLVVLVVTAIVLGRSARGNHAGITTSRAGRVVTLTRLTLGAARRRIRRVLGGLFLSRAKREVRDRAIEAEAAREVAKAMGDMKGVLMKLGQIISFMDDAVPEAYRVELAKLQSQAPPMAWSIVEATLRIELGGDLDDHFEHVDPVPLAAASIGQVHRGRLRDGTPVAIKVQYPGVDAAIKADLDNYDLLSGMVQMVTPSMDAAPVVDELRARFGEELDYTLEATNQEEFRRRYEGDARILVPRVFKEHSSRRVLTTELVEGAMGFYEFAEKGSPADKHEAILAIYGFAFDSIYDHYVFNGDPHPGNYLFLPGGRVAFLDFGCVKHFQPEFVEALRALNRLYLIGDREGYRRQMIEMRYILPGSAEHVTAEWLWEYMHYYYLPVLTDEPFVMTAEHCKKAIEAMFGPAMRKLNMPGEFVLLNRISFGLNSIFARLGARENFRRLTWKYFFKEGDLEKYSPEDRDQRSASA
jgi:predicted unusual protein kinase regulating ubiquinone biosynthesis (AarF/ABC1/UbiB family)